MNIYETNNITLSAYLLSYGYKLQGSNIENGKTMFMFENTATISDAIESFFIDALVPVITFANNLRYLKSIIHQKGEY